MRGSSASSPSRVPAFSSPRRVVRIELRKRGFEPLVETDGLLRVAARAGCGDRVAVEEFGALLGVKPLSGGFGCAVWIVGIQEKLGQDVGDVGDGADHLLDVVLGPCVVGAGDAEEGPIADEVEGLSLIHISEPTRLGMISYAVFCLK